MSKFFGANVKDVGPGTATVADRPAAVGMVVGTAPIQEIHDTPAKRAASLFETIIIRKREDIASKLGPSLPGYTLPAALDAIFDQAGPKGVGEIDVVNVHNPDVHTAANPVKNTDIIGTISASGKATGLKRAYAHYQERGRFSKIIAAPGFSLATGVRAELETICNRTRGRAILNAPAGSTLAQLVAARGTNGPFALNISDRRMVGVWPHMIVVDPSSGNEMVDPYCTRFMGVWLSSIMEYGYQHSPSNRPVRGVERSEIPVNYIPGDAASDPQVVRGAGMVTVEQRYGKGLHTSGNRSLAYPADTDMRNLMHVLFIEDMLDEMVIHYLDQVKDRNMPPAALENHENQINDKLKSMMAGENPVILGGEFRFNRTKTTKASIAEMTFYYRLKYAPPGIGETITTERSIDLNMLASAYGLAS